jgi:serine/threonine protein kinase
LSFEIVPPTAPTKKKNIHTAQTMEEAAKKTQYEVIEQVGKGSYGIVSKIKRKSDNKVCYSFQNFFLINFFGCPALSLLQLFSLFLATQFTHKLLSLVRSLSLACLLVLNFFFQILVWKEMNYGQMSEKEKQLLVAEVNILRDLRSPYVVKYYDRILDRENTKLYIIMVSFFVWPFGRKFDYYCFIF